MLIQNFGVTNKEHYGMLWYFLEWPIRSLRGTERINLRRSPITVVVNVSLDRPPYSCSYKLVLIDSDYNLKELCYEIQPN